MCHGPRRGLCGLCDKVSTAEPVAGLPGGTATLHVRELGPQASAHTPACLACTALSFAVGGPLEREGRPWQCDRQAVRGAEPGVGPHPSIRCDDYRGGPNQLSSPVLRARVSKGHDGGLPGPPPHGISTSSTLFEEHSYAQPELAPHSRRLRSHWGIGGVESGRSLK